MTAPMGKLTSYFLRGLITKALCVFLNPRSSRLASFYEECWLAGMSLADTAELWAFGKWHRQHEFWRFMHQPNGQYITNAGVLGLLAIARSDIDWAFMENDRIDIYTSRGAWYSERLGYLDVIEMCAAGLDYEYVDVLTRAGILPEKCMVLHRAGVPAEYAAAARTLLTENIIEAWDSGLPLEYISAAAA